MLHNIEQDKLEQIKSQNLETSELIDALIDNHQKIVSTITHEIRNPLALVYSSLQLIEHSHPEVKSFRHWTDTLSDVELIALLLNDLSSFNRGNNCQLKPLNLHGLLQHTSLSFATCIDDSDIEFVSYIEDSIPNILGDSVKLWELLLNLLRNARDAVSGTDIKVKSIRLEVKYLPESKLIQIKIADSGCGISSDHLDHIFQPFISYKQGGTGLGLAIAKQIVSGHNGTISVHSELGKGTIFTITLPSLTIN